MNGIALQKWLMRMGLGSKSQVRLWITEGRVKVDGEVVRRFAQPVVLGQQIDVDGTVVVDKAPRTVLLMHKPKKHITAHEDPEGRPGLGVYLPKDAPPLFPVGRLDFNTEGALLWTNDGTLARRVLHPDWGLPKVYRVKIRGHLEEDDPGLVKMRAGIDLGDFVARPTGVRCIVKRTRATWVELILTEGKFREIRRMCHVCRYQIVKLRREAIGPVQLGDLNPRCVRALTEQELQALDRALGLHTPQEHPSATDLV